MTKSLPIGLKKHYLGPTLFLRQALGSIVILIWLLGVLPASAANIIHEFYVPLPEAQVKTSLTSIEPAAGVVGTTIESVVSIVVTGAGTVIHYDEWEDGYEVDINNPAQSTTKIWGDGNNANGIPPSYVNDPAAFTPGSVIVLRNQISLPRNSANLFYDGRDRFGGTKALVVSRASWATTPGTVLAGANDILATMDYGTSYVSPVGDDVSAASMFEYVGLFVMARDDGTSVTIDPDGAGVAPATTITLDRGVSYLVNGGIKKGATVVASKPVQAHLVAGDIGARYESRRFTLYPRDQWSDTTYSPVGTAANGNASFAFLYNPNVAAITVNVTTSAGAASFVVPANGVYQYQLAKNSGAKFVSAGGEQFCGIVCVGANPTANNVHDWGFSMVPSDNLTSQAVVGWGPGSGDLTQNGSPVWVTPTKATRVYVDYNGDGLGALTDPLGGKYDAHYDIGALESRTVYDPDKDGTAMKLYTLDGATISAAWGQDPAVAGPGLPYLDCGTTVLPFPVPVLKKTTLLHTDVAPAGLSIGDTIEYTVTVDNHGLLPLGNLVVLDPLAPALTYVAGSTTRDGVSVPDATSGTPFPLDEAGYNIPIILRGGTSVFKYRTTINAAGTITNTVNNTTYNMNSDATISVPTGGGSTPCVIVFTNAGGTTQTSYSAGSSVYATLTDPDANQSSTTIETVTATFTNAATGDVETVVLTETGVNTGIFRNLTGLPTSTSTGTGTQDGTLYVVTGNTITVSHIDAIYGETCTSTATIAVATQNKYLYLSDPAQALDRVDPVATSDGTTASTAVLDTGGTQTITQDALNTGSSASASSLTIAHTTGTGSNRLMLVMVTTGKSTTGSLPTVSGITYGGQSLALVSAISNGTSVRSEIWKLVNPPSGAGSAVISLSTANPVTGTVVTYTGVNQTTPLGTAVSSAPTKSLSSSATVSSATGELVVDSMGVDGDANSNAPTPGAGGGQSVLMNLKPAIYLNGSASSKAGATSTSMTWSWTGTTQQWAAVAVPIKPAAITANPSATFTQTPAFASAFTLPAGSSPTVTSYYTVSSGSMPGSPTITATLKKGATTIATSSSASASGGLLTFTFPALGGAVNFAASEVLSVVFNTTQSGVSFTLDYDSSTKPSKITLPTTTVISVGTPGVYDAPYPGGSLITAPISGTTAYVRTTASDPFGAYDITSLGLTIDGPGTSGDITTSLGAGSVVTSTAASKTYEYAWSVGATTGTYDIAVQANEGTEGINARSGTSVGVTQLDLGTPSITEFTTGSNGPGTPTYAGNEQVCVRITDLDQNTNANAIETITATITATSGDSELITLTETGINTGIFVYSIPTSTSGGTGANNGTLRAIVGDVLTVVYVDPNDPGDTSSDTATVPPPPGVDGINVTKTLVAPADGVAVIGESISYNVQITNTGSTTLNTVPLTDTFTAAKLTYVSASVTPNTIGSGSLAWTNVGPLTQGQTRSITVNFTAAATTSPTTANTAAATGGTASSSSTVNVTITNPHVTLAKTLLSSSPANVGDNVVFRIVATNDGSSAIATLPIEDTFSGANFEFVSATIAPDASGNGSLLWLDATGAGSLAPAGVITIDVTLRAKGAAAPATNLAAANYTVDVNGDPAPAVQSRATITLLAATINGHVYNDADQSVTFNAGDTALEGITVSLYTDPNGDGDPADGVLVAITTTDVNGVFDFPNLALGKYVAVESQAPGYASSGDSQGANDNRIAVNITSLVTFANNNFFDYLPAPASYASIAGKVWNDADASTTVNGGEVGIANVAVDLVQDVNGNGLADVGEPVVNSTLTATDGTYSFGLLTAGNYVVVEHDLFNWYSTADSVAPNNNMIPVVLTSGLNVTGKDFLDVLMGTTGGKVFRDVNGNGSFDAGDVALANIDVLITDSFGGTQTVVTDSNGDWTVTVPPGSTTIDVQQSDPQFTAVFTAGYTQAAGTDSSTVTVVSGVTTSAGDDGFRQIGTITGHVYIDTNGNGTQDLGEPDLASIDVIITHVDNTTQTVSTDSSGNWTATVPPGSTSVNIDNADPQFPAGTAQTQGTDPNSVIAVANTSTSAGIDGYLILATVTGHLYTDTNGNGIQDGVEPNLASVDVLITDRNGVTQTVSTDSNGNWTASVPPGTTTANINQSDPQYPANGIITQGLDTTTITAVAAATTGSTPVGIMIPATVTGHIYNDTNGNGTQNGGELNLAGIDVLITDRNGATQIVTTDSSGNWSAIVPPGSTSANINETDPQYLSGSVITQGADTQSITAVANASTASTPFGLFLPATINGHLYLDTNGNGAQDVGEPDLANINVVITDANNATQTVSTDSNGNWTASVPPGSTSANVDELDPQFPAGATRTQGTDPTTFTAVAGASTNGGTDGFYVAATVTGHFYIDTNGNGVQNVGEPDLANVDVIVTDSNGVLHTVSTDSNGNWTLSVPPGSTSANVNETDPQFPASASQTQGTDPTTVTAIANASTSAGINGYVILATVTGHLYIDTNGNGTQQIGEPDLVGVDLVVTDSLGASHTVTSDSSGNWTLNVPPGSTTANIDDADPQYPNGSTQTQGTDPTTVTAIAASSVSAGTNGFYFATAVHGHLYVDTNGDGTQNVGEPSLAGVDVFVTDVNDNTQTVTTDSNGDWVASVPPGSITADVDELDPQFPAASTHTQGTDPTTVIAVVGSSINAGTDGYYVPATVTGHLYRDTNGNGTQDLGEPDLANIDVLITDSNSNTQTVTTDSNGNWTATVPPGATTANIDQNDSQYPAGSTITQGQDTSSISAVANASTAATPVGAFIPATVTGHLYVDTNGNGTQDPGEPDLANIDVLISDANSNTQTVVTDSNGNWSASVPPGSTTADIVNSDPQFPAGATQTQGTDPNSVTAIVGASTSAGSDGFYVPATITGHLYVDTNGNGMQDNGESDLANIDVIITDVNNITQTVATNSLGVWTASVPPGSTTADVQEADPQFPFGSIRTEGTDPTIVTAVANTTTSAGDNGYFIPALITGHLYLDANGNGAQDNGELNLGSVDVLITDANGSTQTITTDSSGNWSANVPPGATSALIDHADPQYPLGGNLTQGSDPASITAVAGATTGSTPVGLFIPAIVTGHLYLDTNGNGTQDNGEPDLANIDLIITDANGSPHTVVTDGNGDWTLSVPPGNTSIDVQQADPQFPAGGIQIEGTDPTIVAAVAGATTDGGTNGFFVPATVTGHLYVDTNGNGTQDNGELDLASVDVVITDSNGSSQTVSTNSSGNWSASVPPGSTSANVDETDPQFPVGAAQTQGTDPTTVTAVANTSTSAGTDGYVILATVTGHLYLDTNGNGAQDNGEPNLANIDVLITDVNGATQTVTTDSSGNWSASVPPGTTTANIDQNDPQYPVGSSVTQGQDTSTIAAVAHASTASTPVGIYIAAVVTGHLYLDTNGNGTQDVGEPNLASIDVSITDSNSNAQTVVTDASGNWSASVPPGATMADIFNSDPQFPIAAMQTQGTDPNSVTAVAGASTSAGIDGFFVPATVTGHLYIDTNGNGTQQVGEPDLASIDVLITDSNGSTHTIATDSNGNWSVSLPPGAASVHADNSDPQFPAGAVQTEGTEPTTFIVTAGTSTNGGRDGYFIPATITGHVYLDANGNSTQDNGELNLGSVDVLITDSNGVTQTVATDSSGNWTASVPPGATSARLDHADPQYPLGGNVTQGSDPMTISAVAAATTGSLPVGIFIPAVVTGHLYLDTNGNGMQDNGDPDLASIDVLITDSNGSTHTVSTDSSGNWSVNVPPGNTSVDVQQSDPQFPAGGIQVEGSDPTTVNATTGASTSAGTDGYFIPATVTGHLYVDTNGNGTQDNGEANLASVDVRITDSNGSIQTVSTNSSGDWSASVPPGSTTANVDETDPQFPVGATQTEGSDPTTVTAVANASISTDSDGYVILATVIGHLYIDTNGNGTQQIGEPDLGDVDVLITDVNGATQTVTTDSSGNWTVNVPPGATTANIDDADAQYPIGSTQTEGTDPTTVNAIAGSSISGGTNGFYFATSVTGHLYVDTNGNGTQDVGEPHLASIDVLITDVNGSTQIVTTDVNGTWIASVPPGSTSADVDELDPQFPAGSIRTQGTDPATVTAVIGSSVSTGNNGYYLPATITGHLYLDTNGNGTQDNGEPNLASVDVVITDANNATQTVSTDSNGNWTTSVPPGSTSANVDETDTDFTSAVPAGYQHTQGTDPTTFTAVAGASTDGGTDGYFIPAPLTGHLYVDINGNGMQDPGEPGLEGVDVLISDANGVTQTVTTDSDGNWSASVPPGNTTTDIVNSDPQMPVGAIQTEGHYDPTTFTAVAGVTTDGGINGYFIPATVTGHLYIDTNGNGTQDVGEPHLANIDVILTDILNNTHTVSTDSSGNWTASVPPGSTSVDIDNGDAQFPAGGIQIEGTDPTIVNATAGAITNGGTDGYFIPATVTGHLYVDTNGNGTQDNGEPNLGSVDVLITDSNGATQTVTTDSSGNWTASVPPGSTTANVEETDPQFPAGGTVTQGADTSSLTAVANASTAATPVGLFVPATITGHIYTDTNGNGTQNTEPNLGGIHVLITDSNGGTQTVTTDSDGNWTATVPPGAMTANIDNADYPAGSTITQGADTSSLTAVANASTAATPVGLFVPATVTGHLYVDTNGNGVQDLGEPNLASIDVLITDVNGSTQIATTDVNGTWIASVPPGTTTANIDETDPQYPAGSTVTQGADTSSLTAVANISTAATPVGLFVAATITGHLYLDSNGNGTQDNGEPNLASVDVVITDILNNTHTVTTDSDGNWTTSVPPGSTSANVDEADTDFTSVIPAGYQQTQGTDPTTFTAVAGASTNGGSDGYFIPALITGRLYLDTNGNGTQDPGEPGLENVDVLISDANGITQTVTTDSDGNWSTTVPPGSTTTDVVNSDPQLPTGATQTEGHYDPTTVTAVAGVSTNGGINGYFIPATVTGHLYLDTDGDGTQDIGEPNLANIDVILTDTLANTHTVSTDSNGNWTASVPPGSTSVNIDNSDPQFPAGCIQIEGTDPTIVAAVAGASTDGGTDGYFIPATVTGHLYVDTNGNGTQDNGEANLANIDVRITDVNGNLQTVSTNSSGNWTASVPPGSTSANVDETDPQFPVGATQSEGSDPTTVTAVANASTSAGSDGYVILATVTGHLYLDTNGNGTQQVGEPDLGALDVLITDVNGATQTVTTDSNGNWTASVPPGATTANIDETDPQYPVGGTVTQGADTSSVTAVANASTAATPVGLFVPATVTGHLYVDTNGNGTQDNGEPDLASIDVLITDANNATQTVVTDIYGNWSASVPPGSTIIDVQQSDPQFPAGAVQTQGTDPNTATAIAGVATSAGTDGYFIAGTISGFVMADTNNNDTADVPLEGVTLTLKRSDGSDIDSDSIAAGIQPTTMISNASGAYSFTGLPPDTYQIVETDPAGYISVTSNTVTPVTVIAGATTSVIFVDEQTGMLGDLVWHDSNNNGLKDAAESGIDGVGVELLDALGHSIDSDANASGMQATTTTTAGGGLYAFGNIAPGTYQVRIATPPAVWLSSSATTNTADDQTDDDDNGSQSAPGGAVVSPLIAVGSGESDGTVDFGFTVVSGPYTISGQVRDDYNLNGSFNDGDVPVANVTVKLYADSNGNGVFDPGVDALISTSTTNGLGIYEFGGLPDGTYFVQEIDPRGAVSTGDVTGGNDNLVLVTLAGASSTGNDFLDAVDPAGYAYNPATGQIIAGGSISVSGPGTVTILMDGSSGQYSFLTDGTTGTYVLTYTPPLGYVVDSTRPVAGSNFDPTGLGDPHALGSGENPASPGYLTDFTSGGNPYYFTFDLAAGDPFVINNNIPVVEIKPTSFANWQYANPLGGQNGALQDPDGDGVTNLEEFAFCYNPASGINGGCPLEIVRNLDGTIDAQVRRLSYANGITYQLEYIADLASSGANGAGWTNLTTLTPVVTTNPNGTEVALYQNLASVPALSLGHGYVRVKVTQIANGTVARSEAAGWATRALTVGCQTCSNPFLKCEVFAGSVDGVLGISLNLTSAVGFGGDLAAQFTAGREYYVEVVAGDHEGQRFEINEASSTATSVAINTGSPRNTLGTTIPATLAGDRIMVREHLRMKDLFVPSAFTSTNSPSTADRLLFYNRQTTAFQMYWLFTHAAGTPRWVLSDDAALLDGGNRVIDVCEGLFVHPKGHPVNLVFTGHVRSNAMACPLVAGANMLGNGWPLDMSPTTRKMLITDGFTGTTSSATADRVQFWNTDDSPTASGYNGYFLLYAGALQQWVGQADASIANDNATTIFKSLRAHMCQPRTARPTYLIPNPWTP